MVLELARALLGIYNYDHSCMPFGVIYSKLLSKPETRTIETMPNFTLASLCCVAIEITFWSTASKVCLTARKSQHQGCPSGETQILPAKSSLRPSMPRLGEMSCTTSLES